MAIREPVYDVAVVGAGIVGLAAAVGLARAGHRVALVERAPPERVRGALGFDLRSVALTPGSVDFLACLGGVEDADLAPIEAMHVWEYDGTGSLRFDGNGTLESLNDERPGRLAYSRGALGCLDDAGGEGQVGSGSTAGNAPGRLAYSRGALGCLDDAGGEGQVGSGSTAGNAPGRLAYSRGALAFVAENSRLTTRLWDIAASCLDVYPHASVDGLTPTPDGVLLGGPEIAARLVIGADGANSVVRRLAATTLRYEPSHRRGPQRAIATVARAAKPHGNVAYQRFGRTGPVALLPLRNGADPDATASNSPHAVSPHAVSVIWTTDEPENTRLQALDDDTFRASLNEETEGVLGGFVAVDERLSFPVRQALAADFNPSSRILIIGDAARSLHPLAGQGVNVGLEDAQALVGTATLSDLGAPGRWRSFARERRARSKLMMASMRALLAAYCGPHAGNPWMRLARNAGVRFIDASAGIKAQLVREAMGLGPMAFSRGALDDAPAEPCVPMHRPRRRSGDETHAGRGGSNAVPVAPSGRFPPRNGNRHG